MACYLMVFFYFSEWGVAVGADLCAVSASGVEPTPGGWLYEVWDASRDDIKSFPIFGDLWDRPHQASCIGVVRVVEYFLGGSDFHDVACVHHTNSVAHLSDDPQIMSN